MVRRREAKANKQRGFTLVELLLVLVILGLLGGLVVPRLIGLGQSAKSKAAKAQIDRLSMAVETYYFDNGDLCIVLRRSSHISQLVRLV